MSSFIYLLIISRHKPFLHKFISSQVGDKVEVVEHYERYSDASSGPLRPGDRGTIMEIQRGPRGDRYV